MSDYVIFTDSCSDIPTEIRKKHNIEYVYMGLVVDGVEKRADLDWVDYSPEEFYGWLSEGKKVKTTQVSYQEFVRRWTKVLEEGKDVLYLSCSNALSGSISLAHLVKNELLEKYPERKIYAVDTFGGAFAEGFVVLLAAKQKEQGKTIEEVVHWVERNRLRVNQFATVETLTYLKNAGRIKGSKAVMGNIFGVKPIFISDRLGNNYTIKTVRGTKNADNELFEGVKTTINIDECDEVFIGQGMAQERAEKLKERIEKELNVKATIIWIGPIVGTTCGPGVISTFCFGKEVTRYEGEPTEN